MFITVLYDYIYEILSKGFPDNCSDKILGIKRSSRHEKIRIPKNPAISIGRSYATMGSILFKFGTHVVWAIDIILCKNQNN